MANSSSPSCFLFHSYCPSLLYYVSRAWFFFLDDVPKSWFHGFKRLQHTQWLKIMKVHSIRVCRLKIQKQDLWASESHSPILHCLVVSTFLCDQSILISASILTHSCGYQASFSFRPQRRLHYILGSCGSPSIVTHLLNLVTSPNASFPNQGRFKGSWYLDFNFQISLSDDHTFTKKLEEQKWIM